MTLRYALPLTFLLTSGLAAQNIKPQVALKNPTAAELALPMTPASGEQREGGDIVFLEDFSNGLAGNNGFGAWTQTGPHGNIWKRSTTYPNGAYNTGNTNSRIQSATFSNGFLVFNSDSANSTWNGNTPTALPTAQFTSWDGSIESPVIDLSATPFVEIQFQQRLRYCCGDSPHYLEISTDAGFSWPVRINTAQGAAVNALTATETKKFNITSAIAANPSNVKFRFRHDSEAGTSHYHWQIDDVKIVELFDYDLRVTSGNSTYWDLDAAATYDSLPYSIFPYSQLRPLALNMSVLNNGSANQNATANFTVTKDGSPVLDQDQEVTDLQAGEERTVFAEPAFTPPAESGTYTVTYSITGDNEDLVPADNSSTSTFRVDEFLYARDASAPFAYENGDGESMTLGNMFYVANPATLYGLTVKIVTGSAVGAFVVGQLREDDLETSIDETPEYTLTTQMMSGGSNNNMVDLVFSSPIQLDGGRDYFVGVNVLGDVRIGTSGTSPAQTSFIYYAGSSGTDWYYTTSTPAVRMNFSPNTSIAEHNSDMVSTSVFPNPTNGDARLVYELKSSAPVTIELMDVTGKLVTSSMEGTKAPGQHQFLVNGADLQEGVYFYVVRAGGHTSTGRIAVIR